MWLTKMKVERGFIGGFIVLGFAIFIVGFLTGMLAIAVISVKSDVTLLLFMTFTLGLLTGLLAMALVLVTIRLTKLRESS